MRALPALLFAIAACSSPSDGGECVDVDVEDVGDLAALKAQRCNVSGTMGQSNWYKLSATLPDSLILQLELWPNRGAYVGSPTVTTGSHQLGGADLDFATCGLCLRAIADKGGANQTLFFATGGTVDVTAVAATEGAPFEATITNATFVEVNADHVALADGCVAGVARAKVTGAVTIHGGGGGGGGGGGNGGDGGCLTTVGD